MLLPKITLVIATMSPSLQAPISSTWDQSMTIICKDTNLGSSISLLMVVERKSDIQHGTGAGDEEFTAYDVPNGAIADVLSSL